MSDNYVPLSDRRLLNIRDFQVYAGIGRNNAFKLIRESGCEVRIGRRVFADRVVFDAWCDRQVSED